MKIKMFWKISILSLVFAPQVWGEVTFYHTAEYRSRLYSPFLQGLKQGTMYLEDFEQPNPDRPPYNYLNTPYAQGWNGLRTGSLLGGVQEDVSEGELGFYWNSSARSPDSTKLPDGIHFDFTPDRQGRLPEYAGAALIGRGLMATGPTFNIILVYDWNGIEVTEGNWRIPRPNYDLPYREEDLFLNFEGIYVPGGISRILFRDFLEVDHLTYGYAIPEPSIAWLAAAGSWLWLRRRRIFVG